jgi:hypothetical protein
LAASQEGLGSMKSVNERKNLREIYQEKKEEKKVRLGGNSGKIRCKDIAHVGFSNTAVWVAGGRYRVFN